MPLTAPKGQLVALQGVCADFVVDEKGYVVLLKVKDCLWGLENVDKERA